MQGFSPVQRCLRIADLAPQTGGSCQDRSEQCNRTVDQWGRLQCLK